MTGIDVHDEDAPTATGATQPATPADEPKDLGFGSIVGGERQQRIVNRDGSFTSRREGFSPLAYLNGYHALLTMTWPKFLGIVTGSYIVVNAVFAWLFVLCGPGAIGGIASIRTGGPLLRAFFFSVTTFATIGFGNMYPVSQAANWLVTVESLLAIMGVALLTGIVFARFSRPVARLLFSDTAVVAPYQGKTGFMFRITNARSNQLMELEAKVLYSRLDGHGRRYDQLKLERTRVVFFPLSWTIVHPIDEQSPMWGKSYQDLIDEDSEFDILMSGIDETFSQTVHARSSYKPSEIEFGRKFANIYNPVAPDGTISIDVSRLSEVEDAPLDADAHRHTQTFRHTGHFTGFVAPPPPERPTQKRRR